MNKRKYVPTYLAIICLAFLLNGINFLRNDQFVLAVGAWLAGILLFLSIWGYLKEIKAYLKVGILVLTIFTLYIISSLIWAFTAQAVYLFVVALVIFVTIVNVIIVSKLKELLNVL